MVCSMKDCVNFGCKIHLKIQVSLDRIYSQLPVLFPILLEFRWAFILNSMIFLYVLHIPIVLWALQYNIGIIYVVQNKHNTFVRSTEELFSLLDLH